MKGFQKYNIDIVKYLVDKGADFNVRNNDNKTPLDVATENGYSDIVEYFNEKKVAADAKNNSDNVPSHRYITSKAVKIGFSVSIITMSIAVIGCVIANVGLSMLIIAGITVTAALAGTVAGVTYAVLKPMDKLNEVNVNRETPNHLVVS